MKTIFKILPLFFLFVIFSNIQADAQEMALNSKERFLQLKKIKLLETLEMDEQNCQYVLNQIYCHGKRYGKNT